MDLFKEALQAPDATGVYLIHGADGKPVYIGKAKSIRNRLPNHFLPGEGGSPLKPLLIRDARKFEFILTRTEKEALILENHLIKRHRPRYNVLLRDDKTYPSLRIDMRQKFPRLEIVRRPKADGASYFGPFPSAASVRDTLRFIEHLFPLRKCGDREFENRQRPCLYEDLARCHAPCVGRVGQAEYRRVCEEVVMFLQGQRRELVDALKSKMAEASEAQRFEEAAKIRDLVGSIRKTLEPQRAALQPGRSLDAFGYSREGMAAEVCVLQWREGKLLGSRSVPIDAGRASDPEVLESVLAQYYAGAPDVPAEILLPLELPDPGALPEWLAERRGGPVRLLPPRTREAKRLLSLALSNAKSGLALRRQGDAIRSRLLETAKETLGLSKVPRRIHAFDVSNLQGRAVVASRVVFLDGKPDRRAYRTYQIRDVEAPDDTRRMEEVLARALGRSRAEGGEALPDLVVVDGGLGQLSAARRAADAIGLPGLEILGLAKGSGEDQIWKPEVAQPLRLPSGSPVLLLFQHLRDESHRFALRYHRKVRSKETFGSILDGVDGLGPARRKKILQSLGTLEAARDADPVEFCRLTRLPADLIGRVQAALKERLPNPPPDPGR